MRYHNITKDDMLNGDGLRVVLWVSGCTHHCRGCQNPMTWDPCGGLAVTQKVRQELFDELEKTYISGITLSGGDPLYPGNREEITALVRTIRERYPDKTIWLYTGFSWEQIRGLALMKDIDVCVDGEYEEEKCNLQLHWRGSSNQRVIDVQRSLREGRVCLHCE